ncbi:MAG: adenylate/guanylate cyclase domain-containing protein, partial [Myxococcota bacterium]|nr:adenylate/guanylate cyclase domain-containing protein [Myxococcota bacterium]
MRVEEQAQVEIDRLLGAAQRRNERALWLLLGPFCLIGSAAIFTFRESAGIPFPLWLVAAPSALGLLYTGLFFTWKRPLARLMPYLFVSLEMGTVLSMLLADASMDLAVAQGTSGHVMPFVVIGIAGLRLREGVVIYAGLLAALLTSLMHSLICAEASSAFCMPFLYMWRPILALVLAAAVAITVRSSLRTFAVAQRELLKKFAVRHTLGQLVSEDVAQEMMSSDGLHGERRIATIAFMDLRNFTLYSSSRDPAQVVLVLNRLLEALIVIIHQHGGVVNKFLGDGMLVMFGVPSHLDEHADAALSASLDAVARIAVLAEELNAPSLQLGVGIHSAEVIAGTIGSSDRMEYTV